MHTAYVIMYLPNIKCLTEGAYIVCVCIYMPKIDGIWATVTTISNYIVMLEANEYANSGMKRKYFIFYVMHTQFL